MENIKSFIDNVMHQLASVEWIRRILYEVDIEMYKYVFIGFMVIFGYLNLRKVIVDSKVKKIYKIHPNTPGIEKHETSFFESLNYFKSLRLAIAYFYFFKQNSEKIEKIVYASILVFEVVLLSVFLFFDKLTLGILIVLIFHYVVIGLIKIASTDIDGIVSQELPIVIKHFIKTLSKTSDLKAVIYSVSKHATHPLKPKLEQLSRRMLSEDDEKCLHEFADEINSIWMYTFIFLVLSLKEHSRKEDVIENLKMLSRILDDNNTEKNKELSERRPMIMMNYSILFLAILAFAGNLMFNEVGKDFLLNDFKGILITATGVGLLLATVFINTTLAKKVQ